MLKLKRVYKDSEKNDGYRILADRLWPRGLTKQKAKIHLWFKDIAPSDSLRKWFSHDVSKWNDFEKRYKEELSGKKDLLKIIGQKEKEHKIVTLLFGAKDEKHNQAIVLKKVYIGEKG